MFARQLLFFQMEKNLLPQAKCKEIFFYEVIPAEKPCNLFFDLETSTK